MNGFIEVWHSCTNKVSGASSELEVHLRSCWQELTEKQPNLLKIKEAITNLAVFLCSEGRTTQNLTAVDFFFLDVDGLWTSNIPELPPDYTNLVNGIGTDLHGGIEQPEFHMTPEELLERALALD